MFAVGDEVFGVTNAQFTGGYAEYAVASAEILAKKPAGLTFNEAASVPVVAVTAWQMLFDHAQLKRGQRALIHGGAGNVGAFAVQLAKNAGLNVIATAAEGDLAHVQEMGADEVIDYRATAFEGAVSGVDAVIDTVGGDTRTRSYAVVKPGGIVVTAAGPIPEAETVPEGVRAMFFMVEVTQTRLETVSGLLEQGVLRPLVGTVLRLDAVKSAHEMLAGARHARGKIVLGIAGSK